jgi:small-conductance mechanosensitive channel
MAQLSPTYIDIIIKLVLSLMALLITMAIHRALRRVLSGRVPDPSHARTLFVFTRNALFIACALVILFIWLGSGSSFTVAMGILGAGIAFASQEVIGSFAGYLNIVTGGLYRIGDRVRVGDVMGDVLDISILRTTVMEIGAWVHADQYTGRIVTIANRTVFSAPVFNYTQHWRYVWDEITIPITYQSDWRKAGEIMLERGRAYTSHLQSEAEADLERFLEKYPLHDAAVGPALYVVMTDNWIETTLRYVVEAYKRRGVKARLHRELLQDFESEQDVTVASATFEIVGFPPLEYDRGRGGGEP